MDFKSMHPGNIKIGTLVKNIQAPEIVFTVSKIFCIETDFDNKKYICGYLSSDELDGVPFVYKEGTDQYTFSWPDTPIMKHDIYRYSNHLIKNNDRSKFPDYEIGAEGVLFSRYYGAISKAYDRGVLVYRYEGYGKYVPIPV